MRLRILSLAALGSVIVLQAWIPAASFAQVEADAEVDTLVIGGVGVDLAGFEPNVQDPEKKAVVDRAYAIDAPSLTGIKIDGDLSDWPAAMPRYSLRTLQAFPNNYGLGGLDKLDLTTNPDLSASFSAGYDPKEQVIYLAITVRDDKLILGHKSAFDTDAIEIFIDGLRSEKTMIPPAGSWDEVVKASDMAALQYIGVPGPGPMYGNKSDLGVVLQYGDITKTKTKMAFIRKGDVTIYEWAVQPFDSYPDKPTKLEPGKRVGFDLVVVDKDVPAPEAGGMEPEPDRPVWLCWGLNARGFKGFNADNLGELVLSDTP